MDKPYKIGVSGTGYIATGFFDALQTYKDLVLSKILSQRESTNIGTENELLTKSIDEFVNCVDIIVDCSGNVLRTARVVAAAHSAKKPVITLGSEFHITLGSYFVNSGYLTEAEGDQPGCLAALREEAIQLGFEPLVYGNIKGYLNHLPEEAEMRKWSRINGISLEQTTSFTDGTKLQIEQALVCNGLQAKIIQKGMLGLKIDNTNYTQHELLQILGSELCAMSERINSPISDYILDIKLPAGIFIAGKHTYAEQKTLQYLKLGNGPYYTLTKNYHLCHLEIIKTINRFVQGKPPLLNNSEQPTTMVVAIAKRKLKSGTYISRGIGSFDVRGEAALISDYMNAVPLGLLNSVHVITNIEPGQILTWNDVEIPDSLALKIAQTLYNTPRSFNG